MTLSRIGGSSVAATSITIPSHQAGDIIIIWAYRDGSTAPPTVPTASGTVPSFTTIDGPTGANLNAAVCAWAVAAGTTDTSGTWTNATGLSVEVWRGQRTGSPIGGHAQSGNAASSGGNLAVPAITQTDTSGASTLLNFAGWRTVTAWSAPPSGYTQQSQVATECESVTKDSTTTDGTFNLSGTASANGGYRTQQVELLASPSIALTDTGLAVSDSISALRSRALADTGLSVTDSDASLRLRVLADAGLAISDSLATRRARALTDTGLTISDAVTSAKNRPITDVGVALSEAVASLRARFPTDTGVSVADALAVSKGGQVAVTDTGLTVSDTVLTLRRHVVTDVGLTISDSITEGAATTITDVGVALTDALASRRLRSLADSGLSVADSIQAGSRPQITLSDTGLTVSDSVVVGGTRTRFITDTGLTLIEHISLAEENVIEFTAGETIPGFVTSGDIVATYTGSATDEPSGLRDTL